MNAKAKKIMQENFELTAAPNVYYEKFFAKFSEIKTLEVSKWKSVHLIAYFCERYETLYQMKYTFKYNKSPSKCYEAFQLNRTVAMLNTIDPNIIKNYIDFVFANKIGTAQRRITVIGYLANETFVNEFKRLAKKSEEVTRSTFLPPKYLSVLEKHAISNCQTYGSLAFLWLAAKEDASDPKYNNLFNDLLSEGFSLSTFEGMK